MAQGVSLVSDTGGSVLCAGVQRSQHGAGCGCRVAAQQGEMAGGVELRRGACHSTGPLIIPSLPCFSASKGLDAHTLGGPDATL